MCCRYTLTKAPQSVPRSRGQPLKVARGSSEPFEARFNIAPTQNNLVLRQTVNAPDLEGVYMRWGLIPSWSKGERTNQLLINAKSETAAEKPSFKAAYRRRRCLVPADGFFEWRRQRKTAQPYYFQLSDEGVFFMAGLWEAWQDDQGNSIESYTILTTRSNDLIARYHERMPAILLDDHLDKWLEGDPAIADTSERLRFFEPIDGERMKCRPVSFFVNSNRNEGPDCLNPPEVEVKTQLDLGI